MSSQKMIQPVNEKPGPHQHLGGRGTPRFFAEYFLLPWSSDVLDDKFDPKLATYLNKLKEQIKRLDINKLNNQKKSTKVSECD